MQNPEKALLKHLMIPTTIGTDMQEGIDVKVLASVLGLSVPTVKSRTLPEDTFRHIKECEVGGSQLALALTVAKAYELLLQCPKALEWVKAELGKAEISAVAPIPQGKRLVDADKLDSLLSAYTSSETSVQVMTQKWIDAVFDAAEKANERDSDPKVRANATKLAQEHCDEILKTHLNNVNSRAARANTEYAELFDMSRSMWPAPINLQRYK